MVGKAVEDALKTEHEAVTKWGGSWECGGWGGGWSGLCSPFPIRGQRHEDAWVEGSVELWLVGSE